MKNRIIPFRLMPGSWGLHGAAYDEAEAYYYLEGDELENRLIDIKHPNDGDKRAQLKLDHLLNTGKIDQYEYERTSLGPKPDAVALSELDLRHGKIDQYTYDLTMLKAQGLTGVDLTLKLLDLDYEHGKIERSDYEKQRATLLEEPWIGVIDQGFDIKQGVNGIFFEFEWNDYWIAYLRLHGYVGRDDDHIMEQWFSDVCRTSMNSGSARDDAQPIA